MDLGLSAHPARGRAARSRETAPACRAGRRRRPCAIRAEARGWRRSWTEARRDGCSSGPPYGGITRIRFAGSPGDIAPDSQPFAPTARSGLPRVAGLSLLPWRGRTSFVLRLRKNVAPMAEQHLLPFDEEPAPAPEPGPEPGSRLIEELARVCRERPLEEKVLVAPSLPIGHQLIERLARAGQPWMNLRVETVRTIAHGLVGAGIAREGLKLLSRAQALALVEQACAEALTDKSYFGPLRVAARVPPGRRPHVRRAARRGDLAGRAAGGGVHGRAQAPRAQGDPRQVRRGPEEGAFHRRCRGAAPRGRGCRSGGRSDLSPPGGPGHRRRRARAPRPGCRTGLDDPRHESALRLDPHRARARPSCARSARRTRSAKLSGASSPAALPFDDVEILYTDPTTYPALAWELSREHDVPCTFAAGVAAPFTHPGQAGTRLPRVDRRRLRGRRPARGARLGGAHVRAVSRRGPRTPRARARSPVRSARRRSAGARGATVRPSIASSSSSRSRASTGATSGRWTRRSGPTAPSAGRAGWPRRNARASSRRGHWSFRPRPRRPSAT